MLERSALSLALCCLVASQVSAAPIDPKHQGAPLASQSVTADFVSELVHPTFKTVDVRTLEAAPRWQPGDPIREIPRRFEQPAVVDPVAVNPQTDTVDRGAQRQRDYDAARNAPTGGDFDTPILNFTSLGNSGVSPSDVNGDIGKNHFINSINGSGGGLIAIYDKLTGTQVGPTFALETLGSGGPCASGFGDAVVLYDEMAERWLLTEFQSGGNNLCLYVSSGSDPTTSTWARYAFLMPAFPDYPKYGVWGDAYLAGANEGGTSGNRPVYAFNRTAMLAGTPATFQRFPIPNLAGFGFQMTTPADHDGGLSPPPIGAPGIFMRHRDDEAHNSGSNNPNVDFLEVFSLTVDFATPANSVLSGPQSITIASFDSSLNGLSAFEAFPQPNGQRLDPLREPIMHRLAYRNLGTYEVLVGNLVTDVDGADTGGIRWFELRRTGGPGNPWTLFQEGTYAPADAGGPADRWMAGISIDESGNIALGYSVTRQNPGIPAGLRYVGRLDGDAAGVMTTTENLIVSGGGSQSGTNRWGDYHSMGVDPEDGCTFWFSGNFIPTSNWSTRIAAFRFNECGDPTFSLSATNLAQEVCAAPTGTDLDPVLLTVTSRNGFTDPVDLDFGASGLPVGFGGSFTDPQVNPTGNSQADLSVDNTATPGANVVTLRGVSGATEREVLANVFVTTQNAEIPSLTVPMDLATNVALSPTFTWAAATQAQSYTLEVATDSGFANLVETKVVTGTSTTLNTPLASSTTFYWRVTAGNACGSDGSSTVFSFTTIPAPGDCADNNDTSTEYSYGFETGANGWTSSGTGNTWAQSTQRVNSGDFSWKAVDPTTVSDQRLVSPSIPLPTDQHPLSLQFFHYRDMEENGANCWDAGILEISTDAGVTWTQLGNSAMLSDPYTGTISGTTNPIAGRQAWCNLKTWTKSIVDIDAYAGQTAQFRFRLGSDASVGAEGWYVDDVRVQSCLNDSFVFRNGFED